MPYSCPLLPDASYRSKSTQKLTLPDVPDLAVDLVEHACKLLVLRLWHDWQTIDHCMQEADGVGQQQQQSGDLLLL